MARTPAATSCRRPASVTTYREPAGPGVRVDSGIEGNSVIGGAFDSLLAKLIITGETRAEALARARRALDEYVVDGMATALPFHRAVVRDPAFTDRTVHCLHSLDRDRVRQRDPALRRQPAATPRTPTPRETIVVEVGGKRLEVSLPSGFAVSGGAGKKAPEALGGEEVRAAASGDALTAPMQGTIVKVAVAEGDVVEAGQMIVVLEAMKMEQPLNAHKAGTVTSLNAEVGAVVTSGMTICEIKD